MAERAPGQIVAVVDDDESMRTALQALLRSLGLRVFTYPSAEHFLQAADLADIACLIVDIRMPGMSGIDLQDSLITAGYRLPTIVISAHDDTESRRRAASAGAVAFLRKPFPERALTEVLCAAIESADHSSDSRTEPRGPEIRRTASASASVPMVRQHVTRRR